MKRHTSSISSDETFPQWTSMRILSDKECTAWRLEKGLNMASTVPRDDLPSLIVNQQSEEGKVKLMISMMTCPVGQAWRDHHISESQSETIRWSNKLPVIFLSHPQEQSHTTGCSVVVVIASGNEINAYLIVSYVP